MGAPCFAWLASSKVVCLHYDCFQIMQLEQRLVWWGIFWSWHSFLVMPYDQEIFEPFIALQLLLPCSDHRKLARAAWT